jgi:hypothetical protein
MISEAQGCGLALSCVKNHRIFLIKRNWVFFKYHYIGGPKGRNSILQNRIIFWGPSIISFFVE